MHHESSGGLGWNPGQFMWDLCSRLWRWLTGTPRDQMLLKYYALLTFPNLFYQHFYFLLPFIVPPLLCTLLSSGAGTVGCSTQPVHLQLLKQCESICSV
jgi:hypothetical protein